jgi:hypothetical protein
MAGEMTPRTGTDPEPDEARPFSGPRWWGLNMWRKQQASRALAALQRTD